MQLEGPATRAYSQRSPRFPPLSSHRLPYLFHTSHTSLTRDSVSDTQTTHLILIPNLHLRLRSHSSTSPSQLSLSPFSPHFHRLRSYAITTLWATVMMVPMLFLSGARSTDAFT